MASEKELFFILIFLLSFTQIYSQDGIFLTIRNISNEETSNQTGTTTTYSSSNSSRCQCLVKEGQYSLLQYKDKTDTCLNSNLSETLDVCSSVIFNNGALRYRIEPQNISSLYNVTLSSSEDMYSSFGELCADVERVRRALSTFESLLARTVVCVYLASCDDKNKCLRAYTNWLCTTQLKLHMLNTSTINDEDGLKYNRIKPCLGVCRNVLKHCPYYLPASFQYNYSALSAGDSSDSIVKSHNYIATSYVYGGYPAFACPVDTSPNQSYNTLDNCIGNGATVNSVNLTFLFALVSVIVLLTVM